jgi:glycosyltransferase involved in cell wall biosynthesis
MRIVVNALSPVTGGGVTYLRNLIKSLAEVDKENEYLIISQPRMRHSFHVEQTNFSYYWLDFVSAPFRLMWELFALPLFVRDWGANVLFSPANISPFILPLRKTKLVTVPQNIAPLCKDLIRKELAKESLKAGLRLLLLRLLTIRSLKSADSIICLSQASLKQVKGVVGSEREAEVVYHGRSEGFSPMDRQVVKSFLERKLSISTDYVLFVSNIYAYKNLLELVQAFARVKLLMDEPLKLIVAGEPLDRSYTKRVIAEIERNGLQKEVLLLGGVDQTTLKNLYTGAKFLVFPSTCENCPNILIEAMGCGTPILASNVQPMPDICGNAAVYCDPFSVEDIRDKMSQMMKDADLRRRLGELGLTRSQQFSSWTDTARKVLEVLERTCR